MNPGSDAARRLQASRSVVATYLEWLHTVFLVHDLPAWARGLPSRPVRRSKHHLTDSGLAAGILRTDAQALAPAGAPLTGPLIETFAVNEIARQISASHQPYTLRHYRDNQGHEIDLVIEGPSDSIVGVEAKATCSPDPRQMHSLTWLRDRLDTIAPQTFRAGILLHTGSQSGKVGDRLYLQPIDTLWTPATEP